jgi:hypothetical protein
MFVGGLGNTQKTVEYQDDAKDTALFEILFEIFGSILTT